MSFPGNHELNIHIKDVHEGKNSFKCNICGSEFAEYEGLTRHIGASHGETSGSITKITSVKLKVQAVKTSLTL